jgi:methylmalonyl-CoA/ethylmalonyl-CoA epimerase
MQFFYKRNSSTFVEFKLKRGVFTMINKLSQVSISVHNIEKAVSFYQEILNLPFLFQAKNMAFFDCNGTRLLLSVPESSEFDHPSSILYFDVKDIHESYDHFSKLGVSFRDKPHMITKTDHTETWMVFFHDTDNNVHALMSEVAV